MSPEDKKSIRKIADRLSRLLDVTADISESGWKELTAEISQHDVPTWRELETLRDVLKSVSRSSAQ